MKKEFLNLPFEVKQISDEDPVFFTFEGYASTFGNVDLGDDIVEKGAFIDSLRKSPEVPILWQHNMNEPVGKSIDLFEDNRGLYIKAKLPKKDTLVSGRIIPQIEIGSIKEMSIGFFIEDFEIKEDLRILKKINLFEVSLVTKAMNPRAQLTGFKAIAADKNLPFASRDEAWDASAAIERIRSFTNSDEEPSADYRKYFMFYDSENADKFGSYKLPFVDIIDGEAHIVPKAIFAIAGALEGARGGVELPSDDRAKIIGIVNQCYRKMAREFDDESLVSPLQKGKSIEDSKSLKDIEALLKDAGFSNNESKTLISKIKEISLERDAQEKQMQRDAESKRLLLAEINKFTNNLKKI